MKKLDFLFKLNFLSFTMVAFFILSTSADVIINNSTDCYYFVDARDDCSAASNGPMDSPPGTTQYYDFAVPGIGGAPSTVQSINVTRQSTGTPDKYTFHSSCGSIISPPQTLSDVCNTDPVYVDWYVCSGGTDFCIDIYF